MAPFSGGGGIGGAGAATRLDGVRVTFAGIEWREDLSSLISCHLPAK